MAPNALIAIALVAALGLGGCSAGEDEAAAQAAEAQLAALRAKNDSIRAARAAAPAADSTVADSAAQSTLAATTPADSSRTLADTVTAAEAQSLLADSIRKAREIEVMRETFAYGGGTRDPFASLIDVASTGPDFGNLELVGVYQNLRSRSNSIVVVREKVSLKRYKLRVGDEVGRARLVQIQPRDAVFMIQDFGYERQETLSLRKQEVETP
ncbi:MAG TPA: hypothetical protein VFT84_03900 [Gemmatimonadales bacterium]|nr:hypothetical protein [Gemmatimonadales bacterium]